MDKTGQGLGTSAGNETLTKRIQYLRGEREQLTDEQQAVRVNAESGIEAAKPIYEHLTSRPSTPIDAEIVTHIARSFEEQLKLMEDGCEYVTEFEGTRIFRRKECFTSKTARTIEETLQLIENGYEYVTEIDGTKIFRKKDKYTLKISRTIEETVRLAEAVASMWRSLMAQKFSARKQRRAGG
jgi:hypothetical protein